MKRILTALSLLTHVLAGSIHAECCLSECDYSFYLKVGSGISFAENAHVHAPSPTWNEAMQGYNSKWGNRAIGDFGIGCTFMNMVDVEVSVSGRTAFKYRKFQTPVSGGDSYTRECDLTVIPILFSINLLGREIPCLNWDVGCGNIYPIVGAGVGVSNLFITNFRTTGLPPSGASSPFESFSSENQHTLRQHFTYTALIGFEYNHNERFAIATGYRFFDAGTFKGPRYLRVSTGAAVDVAQEAWKMRFRANEWFIELKILL
jgi:opacity protein-like surface antigen